MATSNSGAEVIYSGFRYRRDGCVLFVEVWDGGYFAAEYRTEFASEVQATEMEGWLAGRQRDGLAPFEESFNCDGEWDVAWEPVDRSTFEDQKSK